MEVGGWVQVSIGIFFFFKSSQNSPKPVLIFWSSKPCVFCLYTLLKVVGYYDLSVLSMSVMGFQKKFGWGWVGGVSSIQFVLDIWNFFNFAKPLITSSSAEQCQDKQIRCTAFCHVIQLMHVAVTHLLLSQGQTAGTIRGIPQCRTETTFLLCIPVVFSQPMKRRRLATTPVIIRPGDNVVQFFVTLLYIFVKKI